MTQDIRIQQASEADLPDILSLYASADMGEEPALSQEAARAMLAAFSRYPNYRLFVACNEQGVVGTYALLVMHNLAHGGAPSAIAEDVVVAPNQRGQGIGKQMMAHAMGEAQLAGCYKLALSSNMKRHAAHAFYDSLGFKRHGISFVVEPMAPHPGDVA